MENFFPLKCYQQGVRHSAEPHILGGTPSTKGRTKLSLSRQESDAFGRGYIRKVTRKASQCKSSPDDQSPEASMQSRSCYSQTSPSPISQVV